MACANTVANTGQMQGDGSYAVRIPWRMPVQRPMPDTDGWGRVACEGRGACEGRVPGHIIAA
eukprot:2195667-Prymnesium_polylepis.1